MLDVLIRINGRSIKLISTKIDTTKTVRQEIDKIAKQYEMDSYTTTVENRQLNVNKKFNEQSIQVGMTLNVIGRKSQYPVDIANMIPQSEVGFRKIQMIFQGMMYHLVLSNITCRQAVSRSHIFQWEFSLKIIEILDSSVITIHELESNQQIRGEVIVPEYTNTRRLAFRPLSPLPSGKRIVVTFSQKHIIYEDEKLIDIAPVYYVLDVEKENPIRLIVYEEDKEEETTKMITFDASKSELTVQSFEKYLTKLVESDFSLNRIKFRSGDVKIPIDRSILLQLKDLDKLSYRIDEQDLLCDYKITQVLTIDGRIKIKEKEAKDKGQYFVLEDDD